MKMHYLKMKGKLSQMLRQFLEEKQESHGKNLSLLKMQSWLDYI